MFYLGLYLLIGLIYSILMYIYTLKFSILISFTVEKSYSKTLDRAGLISLGVLVAAATFVRVFLYPLFLIVDFVIYREIKKIEKIKK